MPCSTKIRLNFLPITNEDLEDGSLPQNSGIITDKIFTLDQSLMKKRYGKLNKTFLEQIVTEFVKFINP